MRNVTMVKDLPFKVKESQDITDTLVRNDKGDWEPDRTPDQIKRISIHHSAVEGGSPESYAKYHVQTLGWRSIGYHICIVGDKILQTNDLMSFTYHTSSNNFDTVSVSISGDLSKRDITTDERNCLYAVIITYMKLFNIPIENVLGHREFSNNNTTCPAIPCDQVREDIKNILMKMERDNTIEAQIERCFAVKNQSEFMYNKAKQNDGDGVWARTWLDRVHSIMKDQGLL